MANLTPIFRASFNKIWNPEKGVDKDPKTGEDIPWERFSITGIFHPDVWQTPEFKAMQQAALDARRKHFPTAGDVGNGVASPFRKGVQDDGFNGGYDLAKYPEYSGNIIVGFSSKNRPIGVLSKAKRLLDPKSAEDRALLYSGCWCRAGFTTFKYIADGGKKRGVSFGLSSLMIIKDGEPLIAISDPFADFKDVPVEEEDQVDNSHMLQTNPADPFAALGGI